MPGSGLQIGRVGRDGEGPVVYLTAAESWSISGNSINVRGAIHAEDIPKPMRVSHAIAVRDQLVGYRDNLDEPFVPVMWDLDPTINGFYSVVGAEVDFLNSLSLTNGIFPFSVDLVKLSDFSFATVESVVRGWVRRNSHGFTSADALPWLGTPSSKSQYMHGVPGNGWSRQNRRTATGDVMIATSAAHSYISAYSMRPEDWLQGACSLEIPYRSAGCEPSVGAWVAAVGQRVPLDPMAWRITNGIISIQPKLHPSGVMIVELKYFAVDNSSKLRWLPVVKRYEIVSSAGTFDRYDFISVLRNSPEQVTLRIGGRVRDFDPATSGRYFMDITLRRGSRFVQFYCQSDRPSLWDVTSYEAEPATMITGGIKASSPNADGSTYLVMTGRPFGFSDAGPAQGGLVTADVIQVTDFGIGFVPPNPTGIDTEDSIVKQYFAVAAEKVLYSSQEITATNF